MADLPEPKRPMMTKISPARMSKLALLNTDRAACRRGGFSFGPAGAQRAKGFFRPLDEHLNTELRHSDRKRRPFLDDLSSFFRYRHSTCATR